MYGGVKRRRVHPPEEGALVDALVKGDEEEDYLGEEVVEDGFLRSTRKDLHKRLSFLFQRLRKLPQKFSLKGLEDNNSGLDLPLIAKMLGRDSLLIHQSPEIRVIVCRCLIEILRIFAPDAPYERNDLLAVFSLFLRQISAMPNMKEQLQAEMTKFLNRSSRLDAFSIIANEADFVEEAIPILQSAIVPDISEDNVNKISCILVTLVRDSANFTVDALELLLKPLTESRPETPLHKAVVEMLLMTRKRMPQLIHEHRTLFLRKVVDGSNVSSVKSEDILFQKLFEVDPYCFVELEETLIDELTSSNVFVRRARVNLVLEACARCGRVAGTLPAALKKLLLAVTQRFLDADAEVRKACCVWAGEVIQKGLECSKLVGEKLTSRIMDPDERVRAAASSSIISAADSRNLDETAVRAGVGRILDKKPSVRKAAVTETRAFLEAREEDASVSERGFFVIGELCTHLRAISSRSQLSNYEIDDVRNIVDSVFSGCGAHRVSAERRVSQILRLAKYLSKDQLKTFSAVLHSRALLRRSIKNLMDSRLRIETPMNTSLAEALTGQSKQQVDRPLARANREWILNIKRLTSDDRGKSDELPADLLAIKDRLVFTRISECVLGSLDDKTSDECASDAVKRVGSKSALGEYLRRQILPRLTPGVFSKNHLEVVFRKIAENENCSDEDRWFLETAAREYPDLFHGLENFLIPLMNDKDLRIQALRIMVKCGFVQGASDTEAMLLIRQKILSTLSSAGISNQEAKYMSRCLLLLPSTENDSAKEIVNQAILPTFEDFDLELMGPAFMYSREVLRRALEAKVEVGSDFAEKTFRTFLELSNGRFLGAGDPIADVISAGLRAAWKFLLFQLRKDRSNSAQDKLISTTFKDVSNIARKIASRSLPLHTFVSESSAEDEILMLMAAKTMIKLTRVPNSPISEASILSCVKVMEALPPRRAEDLSRWIYEGILRKKTPFRWIVVLLLGPDFNGKGSIIQTLIKALRDAVARMPLTSEEASGLRSTLPLLPESTLPTLIWSAAHEQDPTDTGSRGHHALKQFLESLVQAADHASSAKAILKVLSTAEDSQGDDDVTGKVQRLANLGLDILQKRIQDLALRSVAHSYLSIGLPSSILRPHRAQ